MDQTSTSSAKRTVGRPFKPGQSGNPAGRARGSRNHFSEGFLHDLADDFEHHGRVAIERMRRERPAEYIRVIASLLPRRTEAARSALDEVADAELAQFILAVRAAMAERESASLRLGPLGQVDEVVTLLGRTCGVTI